MLSNAPPLGPTLQIGRPGRSYLATRPSTLSGFSGSTDTLREMIRAAQGARGERSMVVRGMVDRLVSRLQPKDYAGEIVAIRNWVAENIRYVNDPLHVELIKDPETLVDEYEQMGVASGDCDDICCCIATFALTLGRDAQYVPVGFGARGHYTHVFARILEPRTRIWIICDPVAGTNEREMAQRVSTYQLWSLDEPPEHGPIRSE
jgi:hypothetical protein